MIVGQQDEAALGILSTAVVSLAAQAPPEAGARFYLIGGKGRAPRSRKPL